MKAQFNQMLEEQIMKIRSYETRVNKAKQNLQIINVARGGIIDETALIEALDNNLIDRAAIDVFEHEPPTDSPLIQHDKIIVTPHLGASTVEAQEKVAVSVSEEIIEILQICGN